MKKVLSLLCIFSTFMTCPLRGAANDTFVDYQNYNHGYCPTCNAYPCQCNTEYVPGDEESPYPQNPSSCPPACDTCSDPCNPDLPFTAKNCGVPLYVILAVILVLIVSAVTIIGSNNGAAPNS